MVLRILPACVGLASGLLVACYPVAEDSPRRPVPRPKPNPPAITPNQQTTLKAPPVTTPEAVVRNHQASAALPAAGQPKQPSSHPPGNARPPEPAQRDVPIARKAPGKEGFVLSPYNNKLILVRGIPSGTILPDAAFPASDNKYFRVP
ncbi:MAG: hypothetical protein NTW21_31520 [Verrucomicrobia bacterium]|nr:hypothetical protein [Verrucomicrobiota bacterium]